MVLLRNYCFLYAFAKAYIVSKLLLIVKFVYNKGYGTYEKKLPDHISQNSFSKIKLLKLYQNNKSLDTSYFDSLISLVISSVVYT